MSFDNLTLLSPTFINIQGSAVLEYHYFFTAQALHDFLELAELQFPAYM